MRSPRQPFARSQATPAAHHRSLLLVALLALGPQPLLAQFSQYSAPGSLAVELVPLEERIRSGAESSRWRLGKVRVDPRAWLRNVGYINNVFAEPNDGEQRSDTTASVGAGVVGYGNLGPDLVVSAYVLPEYVWWNELSELRQEQVNLGFGLFGFFNRIRTQLDVRHDETQRFLNSELLVPVDIQDDRAQLRGEVDVRGPFALFGAVIAAELRYSGAAAAEVPEAQLETLDRDELVTDFGIAYRPIPEARIGLGIEVSEAEFLVDPEGRSNRTVGPLIEARHTGNRFDLDLSFVYRDVEFDAEGAPERRELTGNGRLGWKPGRRIRVDLYGGRSLVYSALSADRVFLEDRIGLSVGSPWFRRLRLRGYFEVGTNDFGRLEEQLDPREDDLEAWGLQGTYEVTERIAVELAATTTEYESNLPGFDRKISVYRIGLRLAGDPRPW